MGDHQALAKVPADRFATAGEFAEALADPEHAPPRGPGIADCCMPGWPWACWLWCSGWAIAAFSTQ